MILTTYIPNNRNAFINKVNRISGLLNIDPEWLMIVMYAESRLKPYAVNSISRATGLIQFMPSTARGLGTSVEALRKMNNLQQLDYVYKYYRPYKGRLHSVYDLYMVTFLPAGLGKPDNWVFHTSKLSAGLIASQNKIIDINRNGQITVAEFRQYVDNILAKKNIILKKKA